MNLINIFSQNGVTGAINVGSKAKTRKVCSYILQDDNLFAMFSVQETMFFASRLKVDCITRVVRQGQVCSPYNFANIYIVTHIINFWFLAKIDGILQTLNLDLSKNTRCSDLSGGQKKRLSIALELLDNSPVLFLDEPTT